MNVPSDVRKCVVFLGRDTDHGIRWCATGFFVVVSHPAESDDADSQHSHSYLITARHVIDGIRYLSPKGRVYVRLNLTSGGSKTVESELNDWRFHPTREVDAAALLVPQSWLEELDGAMLTEHSIADDVVIQDHGIGPGQDVFITGLFINHYGERKNIPIIRVGNIAAMPEEKVRMKLDRKTWISAHAYLIESRSIKGLSGSPVFTYRDSWEGPQAGELSNMSTYSFTTASRLINDTSVFTTGAPSYYWLGLVHGHWEAEVVRSDIEDIDDGIKEYVNTGIAIVVPATDVWEVLDHPDFVEHRGYLAEREVAAGQTSPDESDGNVDDSNRADQRESTSNKEQRHSWFRPLRDTAWRSDHTSTVRTC